MNTYSFLGTDNPTYMSCMVGCLFLCHNNPNPLSPPWRLPYSPVAFLRFLIALLTDASVEFFTHHFCVRPLRFVGEVTQNSKALPYCPSWNTSNPFALRLPCQSVQASQTTFVVRLLTLRLFST